MLLLLDKGLKVHSRLRITSDRTSRCQFFYNKEHGDQLSSAQKVSVRKCFAPGEGDRCGCDCKHQHANWKRGLNELKALAASVLMPTNNVDMIAARIGAKN